MYGDVIREAPEGFVPYHQWPEYDLVSDAPPFLGPRLVGKNPLGMYRRIWPIVVEEYISDEEPVLADSDPGHVSLNRGLIWQRIFRTDIPHGWRRLSLRPPQLEGFAILDTANYSTKWSESARRYRRKWRTEFLNISYTIEQISLDEFLVAYMQSPIKNDTKTMYRDIAKRKIEKGAGLDIWAVRHTESGEIAAGMMYITSPTCHGSYYLCGFILEKYRDTPVMVGLVDAWHERSLAGGIRFLHFGRFWQKGDPKDWKGFSLFKSKFGLHYISYPPALWRFARGKLF
jgi:hypothetical protein